MKVFAISFQEFKPQIKLANLQNSYFFSTFFPEIFLATGSVLSPELLFSFSLVSGNQCITRSAEFKLLRLNKSALKNVLVSLNQTKGDVLEKGPTHR